MRPFPDVDAGVWEIRAGNGAGSRGISGATWGRSAPEIFYSADGQLWSLRWRAEGDSFRYEPARALFELVDVPVGSDGSRAWDAAPDGQRFIVSRPERGANARGLSPVRRIELVRGALDGEAGSSG